MNLINWLIYIYILLKPYYLSSSGTLQLGDFFILIAFVITVYKNFKSNIKNEVEKKIEKNNIYLILFLICITIINLIYSVIYSDDFLKPILYYLFNFMGIYVFTYKISDKDFLDKMKRFLIIDILVQLIIYIFGIGRYFGTSRYMGTFNDPNQYGFFIIMAMMLIYTIKNILNEKNNVYTYIIYLISIYLILISSSTGMIVAIVAFLSTILISFIMKLSKFPKIRKITKKMAIIIALFSLFVSILITFQYIKKKNNINYKSMIAEKIENLTIWSRLEEKIKKINADDRQILDDRHLDKVFNNPIKLIYGAGEGKMDRFGNNKGEIHSTFISIMFYYGIIPTVILIIWIYKNLKGLNLKQLAPYIAIFIESFTLINNRQLFFWVIIIMANLYNSCNKEGMD